MAVTTFRWIWPSSDSVDIARFKTVASVCAVQEGVCDVVKGGPRGNHQPWSLDWWWIYSDYYLVFLWHCEKVLNYCTGILLTKSFIAFNVRFSYDTCVAMVLYAWYNEGWLTQLQISQISMCPSFVDDKCGYHSELWYIYIYNVNCSLEGDGYAKNCVCRWCGNVAR